MESKDDSICKNNDVEIKRNLFKINRGTKKIFNIKNSDICFLSSKKTLYHCLIVSKLLDNNDIKFISNPNKVLWHIWRHPVWIIQLLCWLVLLLPLIAGPITPLYHYLHYALWGISYNLAKATLSLYSGPCYKLSALLETNLNTRQQRAPALRSGFLGHESVEGPWLEDVSGCSPLSGEEGLCVSCRAMILHDTLMVTINALIGQLNRIKSNLPAQHARKI